MAWPAFCICLGFPGFLLEWAPNVKRAALMIFDLLLALVAAPLLAGMALFGFLLHVWNRESHRIWHVTAVRAKAPRDHRR